MSTVLFCDICNCLELYICIKMSFIIFLFDYSNSVKIAYLLKELCMVILLFFFFWSLDVFYPSKVVISFSFQYFT